MTHPELWAGQGWPMTDEAHEFLVPAFNRIGRHLHGEKWRDDFPTFEPVLVKALHVEEASPEERAWAHRLLSALFPESYQEDYEEPPIPPRYESSLLTLGGGPLPQMGRALGALGQIELEGTPTRPPGWWFTNENWERFRAAVHYQNELQKPKLAMVNVAARWLFNQIVRGAIVPYVQHARNGGGWAPTTVDDWRMPSPERLRMRIQRCTMVPGRPAIPAGTHWIILNKAQLTAAIEKEARERIEPAADGSLAANPSVVVEVASAVTPHDTGGDDSGASPAAAAADGAVSARNKEGAALVALSALYPNGIPPGLGAKERDKAVTDWLAENFHGVKVGTRLLSAAATRHRNGARA